MADDTFAGRLVDAMAEAGFKQADVIRVAGELGGRLGKSQVSQYVSGKTLPRADVMALLARVLDVRERWLAAGEGPMRDRCDESPGHLGVPAAGRLRPLEERAAGRPAAAISAASSPDGSEDVLTARETQRSAPMREFKKSSKLDNVLYDVRGPVVDEASRMEEDGARILKLNIGNPAPFGFRAPDEVVFDMRQQLTECEGYSDSRGLFAARKAIMQYAQLRNIPGVDMKHIYTGNGVSELIQLAMHALIEDGDEILIPSPDYPLWTACVTLAGGNPVHYICDEQNEWNPDLDDIEKKVTSRTKAIVIINPNNPTGAVYSKELLQEIVEIARQHNLIIFADEIYDKILYDEAQHHSIAALAPDLLTVTFNGLSKTYRVAGFRQGWMVLNGPKKHAKGYIEGLEMLASMRLCANVPAQHAIQTALGGYQSISEFIIPGGRLYEQRNRAWELINDIPGVSCMKPKGALYMFPKIDAKRFNIHDDQKMVLDFLLQEKVLLVQGTAFNWPWPDHVRIVTLPREDDLEMAISRFGRFLSGYHQL